MVVSFEGCLVMGAHLSSWSWQLPQVMVRSSSFYVGGVMKVEGKKSALRIIAEIVLMIIILLIASHYTM